MNIDPSLKDLDSLFPAEFTEDQKAQAKTLFLKNLSLEAHRFYGGKMQTVPKCGLYGLNWFNVWYTPGVSKVSTSVRDDNDLSFSLSNRGNLVAVVSDSTRVLGDGDCTPPGGLGVMEGKAMIMKYLGGVDAVPLCIDSKGDDGKHDPDKIISFVKMVQHSFGAINLEDISQPNCFKVLDELREACDIPVWHDDAQGTACITLAGLLNALKLAGKKLSDAKIVLLGAGAANTTIARLILADGGDPAKMTVFDSKGSLHLGREDIKKDKRNYRKWEICEKTNPGRAANEAEALKGADVLIALSTPGPDTVKREWISSMAKKAIVFVCANPVPEIWPYAAKEAGAFIVATGRGDFPNQVNNSVCFPGILKGALLVRAKKITDGMAIRCAHSIADFSEKRGITPDSIIATMEDTDVFAQEAADVAQQAIKEGVARLQLSWEEVYNQAKADIAAARALVDDMKKLGHIKEPPKEMLEAALAKALEAVKK
ncbi:malate dehydrogenase (oxaloacetate-decarboxylating) [Treponema primitia ZAS-2]|uniref:Malate dehydrogenase (Oxaloacetate-decarboxylating) n=1 Tax=Treponema primitia (strain ATCC BAA-887 / DSM 12427 / ZAS-2) TaxID=545694 RepID=F5YMA9_TREPZ|nr:NADP-dependent malic enzyme [Treponema primitia]AEF86844.1 malate dehydrogenase (oxaloacetate-decarboxylating) [Treponema primitia ZAS-2]